ncbi:hypothetical protein Trydic_g12673 [Trypoxylus dichotomus]
MYEAQIWILILFLPMLLCEEHKVTDQVYFDIAINNKHVGRIVIGLFGDIVPRTVKNFKTLATKGIQGRNYTGSTVHRVVQRFMIQGGDILFNNGSGSISIYGDHFEDENFNVKHTGSGYVGMANYGPDSNGCQFFITTIATPWLDGNHVVFGKVVQGEAIVHKIEHLKTDVADRPLQPVEIIGSGLIPTAKPFYVSDHSYGLWAWIQAGIVPLTFSFLILSFFHWALRRLDGHQISEKLD